MKLNEQSPLDDLTTDPETGERTITPKPKVIKRDANQNKKADANQNKKADPNQKKRDKIKQSKKANAEIQLQKDSIRQSIIFYEAICKQLPLTRRDVVPFTRNQRNEIFRLLTKYVTIQYAPYIDMLIRIIYEPKLISSRQKNPKAYDYWVSRNGETATRFAYLESIDNAVMHRLDYIFNGSIAKGLGSDDFTNKLVVKFKKQFLSIYPNILKAYWPQNNHIMKMNGRKSTDEIEKLVLNTYNNKIFGQPKI
jgi:hypothetical protein